MFILFIFILQTNSVKNKCIITIVYFITIFNFVFGKIFILSKSKRQLLMKINKYRKIYKTELSDYKIKKTYTLMAGFLPVVYFATFFCLHQQLWLTEQFTITWNSCSFLRNWLTCDTVLCISSYSGSNASTWYCHIIRREDPQDTIELFGQFLYPKFEQTSTFHDILKKTGREGK